MLPVSMAAEDLQLELAKWLEDKYRGEATKLQIVQEYANGVLFNEREPDSGSPFEPAQGEPCHLEESLKEIKEVWLRLLVYVAGRCRAELHKRQHRKFDFFTSSLTTTRLI